MTDGFLLAEKVGFEPTIPCGILAFQASALGQTMRPLHVCNLIKQGDYNPRVFDWKGI